MTIHFYCEHCQRGISAPERYAGGVSTCPSCGGEIAVPCAGDADHHAPPAESCAATDSESDREDGSWDKVIFAALHQASEAVDPVPSSSSDSHDPAAEDQGTAEPIHVATAVTESAEEAGATETFSGVEQTSSRSSRNPAGESDESNAKSDWFARMLNAFLDPRSIQWLLTLGGGFMVLGLLIWLISTGIFTRPVPLAILFGTASLGILVSGWWVALCTRFKMAGRALAFLGCVVLPLNLWFYHSQDLLLLSEGLWCAGAGCVIMYLVTLMVLRDPLFVYAVEAGITLTAVLLLGSVGQVGTATNLSLLLVSLGFISIHSYYAFPGVAELFDRKRFGLPAFWCGHLQLAAGLMLLFTTQLAGWLQPLGQFFDMPHGGVLLTNAKVSGMIWLTAAYLYFSSDLVIRKIGIYIYAGTVALVMAEISLLDIEQLGAEGVMAILALTACGVSLTARFVGSGGHRYARVIAPPALLLSVGPVLLGILLYIQSNLELALPMALSYGMSWKFVGAALVVAVANRVSGWLFQTSSQRLAATYIFFSASALVLAAAGYLQLEGIAWLTQVAILMVIPLGYLLASRLWRGYPSERPVGWVAQATTVLLMVTLLCGTLKQLSEAVPGSLSHLLISVVLLEAALFYGLASVFFRTSRYSYISAAALCAATWQFVLHFQFPHGLLTALIATIGLAAIIIARFMGANATGLPRQPVKSQGAESGLGFSVLWFGHGALSVALIVALLSGLAHVAAVNISGRLPTIVDWWNLGIVSFTVALAAIIAPRGTWTRVYSVGTVAMMALVCLTIHVALDLTPLRKLEIFLVVAGCVMLSASYIARFREGLGEAVDDVVTCGLWLGSSLVALPILITVFHHWSNNASFAVYDEIALITLTFLMLMTGLVWQVKGSTAIGGGSLFLYLLILVASLIYRPQVAIGIYLAIGGGVVFAIGLMLAIYRERLTRIPERIANRQGVFQVMSWR